MRMVLLKHDLPDGSTHFDWMIERDPGSPNRNGLITFRVSQPIDRTKHFTAVRIADHREEYLTYQGMVSGGRGTVLRLAQGNAEWVRDGADTLEVKGTLGPAAGTWVGRERAGVWDFVLNS